MNRTSGDPSITSPAQKLVNAAWPYLSGKRGLIILALAIVVAGTATNWSWLVAAGLAPLLIGILPCAAMCVLGLCMIRGQENSSSTDTEDKKHDAVDQIEKD